MKILVYTKDPASGPHRHSGQRVFFHPSAAGAPRRGRQHPSYMVKRGNNFRIIAESSNSLGISHKIPLTLFGVFKTGTFSLRWYNPPGEGSREGKRHHRIIAGAV